MSSPVIQRSVSHDDRHHVVFECDGAQHTQVFETLRAGGVTLIEAGPASHYARDIQVRQRSADAEQFARAKSEVHRLRASIVESIAAESIEPIREALKHAERLEWDWCQA